MNEIPDNTFYQDFEIANRFGANAILDTYKRAIRMALQSNRLIISNTR